MIRQANLDDIDQVCALALRFCDEAKVEYMPQAVVQLICHYLNSPHCVALVYEKAGVLVGLYMGFVDTNCFSLKRYAMDRIVYVLPSARDKTVSNQLYKAFVSWAKGQGCQTVLFSCLCSRNNEQLARVVEWLGGTKRGYLLEKTL